MTVVHLRTGPLAGVPTLEDLPPLTGAEVLVRVDFNVPLVNGPGGKPELEDDYRIAAGWRAVDIGPRTRTTFARHIHDAGAVFWNGPVGAFEDPRFAGGTQSVAAAVAAADGFTVVGGGDTVAAIDEIRLADRVSFVSTGGGASLAFLEHGDLPGLRALREASNAPRIWTSPCAAAPGLVRGR